MIKRKYEDFSINKPKISFSNKRTKIYESKYITIDMNEKMFNNYSIYELPIKLPFRKIGQSKMNFFHICIAIASLLRIRFNSKKAI